MQGNSRLFQQAQGNQPLAILGTLLIVYIVLGVLYESYVHPLTILSTLPSAGVGALLALQLLNTEFSLVAMLGVFLLVGVVMKNAILMIDVALQLEREKDLPPYDAIREACLLRLRPILMTTLAALLGALPLMLFQGEGAELRRPLGIAIVGGLFVSQVLTLYTTPVVYLYLDRMRLWGAGRRARRRAAPPSRRRQRPRSLMPANPSRRMLAACSGSSCPISARRRPRDSGRRVRAGGCRASSRSASGMPVGSRRRDPGDAGHAAADRRHDPDAARPSRDFVLRFEYRLAAAGGGAELLLRPAAHRTGRSITAIAWPWAGRRRAGAPAAGSGPTARRCGRACTPGLYAIRQRRMGGL